MPKKKDFDSPFTSEEKNKWQEGSVSMPFQKLYTSTGFGHRMDEFGVYIFKTAREEVGQKKSPDG